MEMWVEGTGGRERETVAIITSCNCYWLMPKEQWYVEVTAERETTASSQPSSWHTSSALLLRSWDGWGQRNSDHSSRAFWTTRFVPLPAFSSPVLCGGIIHLAGCFWRSPQKVKLAGLALTKYVKQCVAKGKRVVVEGICRTACQVRRQRYVHHMHARTWACMCSFLGSVSEVFDDLLEMVRRTVAILFVWIIDSSCQEKNPVLSWEANTRLGIKCESKV